MMSETLYIGPDGRERCQWCASEAGFLAYHDKEWGFPVADDNQLFEMLTLESFQSGLSWRTILAKREGFRKAFKHFDIHKIARFKESDVERLLADEGIVRHRGKIEATINNAQRAREMIKSEGSLAAYFWQFEEDANYITELKTRSQSDTSIKMSKELKKRGWKFVGPTTVYSFLQAVGLVNDHSHGCVIRDEVIKARKKFKKPSSRVNIN